MFFVCAALKVRKVSRRCPGRSRMCCYHAVIVLTVRHGAPSLCSRCVTVFLSSRHCAHSASRCSYKLTRPIGTGWLTQVQAIQSVNVLTVGHGAPASSPAPSAQGGSRKFRQTRTRVDAHKQALVRISKPSELQRCRDESISSDSKPNDVLREFHFIREAHKREALMTQADCVHIFLNALPVLTSDRFSSFIIKPLGNQQFWKYRGSHI